jgi:hypothetical protein
MKWKTDCMAAGLKFQDNRPLHRAQNSMVGGLINN